MQTAYKLSLVISMALLLMLIPTPQPVSAQWPPFYFQLIPSYAEGQITYNIRFFSQVSWQMSDLTFKIPLPEGTRFLEANAQSGTEVDFDGAEVSLFTALLYHRSIRNASFVVEVTDPARAEFTTHAWIAWQGDQPGDYLTKDVSIDITRQSLNWEAPARSRLQLEVGATVADDVVTYVIYPKNVRGSTRMQDLKINVPLPEGTTFLSAEAPPSFVTSFDGREVSFSTLEIARGAEVGPLSFRVSTEGVTDSVVVTHAWATWKNVGWSVGRRIASQEETITGDIVMPLHTSQRVVSDPVGDVPFSNYDITSVVLQDVILQETGLALKSIFYTSGDVGPVGEPLAYNLYIDNDCSIDTGQWKNGRGVEYRIGYDYMRGRATLIFWNEEKEEWNWSERIKLNSQVSGKSVTMWIPYSLLEDGRQFCWVAEAKNRTKAFNPNLPTEKVPNQMNLRLTQYEAAGTAPVTETEFPAAEPSADAGTFIDVGDVWQYLPGWSESPSGWQTIEFDDSDWFSGPTSIGYGSRDHATDLSRILQPVQNEGTSTLVQRTDKQSGMILAVLPSGKDGSSVLMRRTFTTTDSDSLTELILEIDYEGGFIAYLNGVEVARRGLGVPGLPVSYDTLATDLEVETPEIIDLGDYITDLVSGTNILAIQGHQSSGNSNLSLTPKLTWEFDPADIPTPTPLDDSNAVVSAPSGPFLDVTDISGKLAVPVDNGQVAYDVYVFSMPDGREIVKIPNARQPNFRFDGEQMLINREGGGVENVFEYNLADGTEERVSDAPQDWHPFYDPWGNRVVYGNFELASGSPEWMVDDEGGRLSKTVRKPFIFVQCSLLPPHQEEDPRCQNLPWLGVLVPAGQAGEIQGAHPVWTSNDMIAYKGCNTWAGSALCGIYIVPSTSTKGFSDGFIPRQLTRDTSDIPSDTKGNLIAFTSRRDGNWEAYVMDLNGDGLKNLSNSPDSNDGLPTISPDGNWVAFVSDRDGRWAIWVVPVIGGSAQKLFDLPADVPWGDGKRAWTNERISWGP